MKIGLDLDNTIICYDGLFRKLGLDHNLVPVDCPNDKKGIHDYLNSTNKVKEWWRLQAEVYGPGLEYAKPYPGVKEFIHSMRSEGHEVIIISHKSRFPYSEEVNYDLHEAARQWISNNLGDDDELMLVDGIFLEVSLEAKIKRIEEEKCDVFVDDLPKIFNNEEFPREVKQFLFSPKADCQESGNWHTFAFWDNLKALISDRFSG